MLLAPVGHRIGVEAGPHQQLPALLGQCVPGVAGRRIVRRILDRPLDDRGVRRRQRSVEFEQRAVHLPVRMRVPRGDAPAGHGVQQRGRCRDARVDLQERYRGDGADGGLHDAARDGEEDVAVGADIRHRMRGELAGRVGVGGAERAERLDDGALQFLLVERELIGTEGSGAVGRAQQSGQRAVREFQELFDVRQRRHRLGALRAAGTRSPVAERRHRDPIAPGFELPLQPGQGHIPGVDGVPQRCGEGLRPGSACIMLVTHHSPRPVCEAHRPKISIRPHARTSGDRVSMWGHMAVFAGRVPVPAIDRPDAVMPPLLRMS